METAASLRSSAKRVWAKRRFCGKALRVDFDAPRERLFPAVLAEVSRVPTFLIVEDVHWADRATLDLLKYIARRIARTHVLLAISYRDDEVAADHPLVRLLGDAALKRLWVDRLSAEAVGKLGGKRRFLPPDTSSSLRC